MKLNDNIYEVDRFEDGFAVLENSLNGEFLEIEKAKLPNGVCEGDSVFVGEDGAWQKDLQATLERAARIMEKQRKLFE